LGLKETITERFDAFEDELREISSWMYHNPELAYEEIQSSARPVGFLRNQGMDVEHPNFGLETAFAARAGTTRPEVIICAEYDALPEVGHACGHNVIAAAACGAGAALAPLAGALGVRVRVQGTPAEEAYGGKVDRINAGGQQAIRDGALATAFTVVDVAELDPLGAPRSRQLGRS